MPAFPTPEHGVAGTSSISVPRTEPSPFKLMIVAELLMHDEVVQQEEGQENDAIDNGGIHYACLLPTATFDEVEVPGPSVGADNERGRA